MYIYNYNFKFSKIYLYKYYTCIYNTNYIILYYIRIIQMSALNILVLQFVFNEYI